MGNFVLQTSPCSSLILRIRPWKISVVFLLCYLSLPLILFWAFLSSTGSSCIKVSLFLPLSLLFSPWLTAAVFPPEQAVQAQGEWLGQVRAAARVRARGRRVLWRLGAWELAWRATAGDAEQRQRD
jgi:hypothetical protein